MGLSKYLRLRLREAFDLPSRDPQLDGVRGVAIVLVVIAHALQGTFPYNISLFPSQVHTAGGITGVQLFFVLSGYLITVNLVREIDGGAFSFGSFYGRRVARLYPALVTSALAGAAYWLIVGHTLTRVVSEVARAVTYTTNLGFLWSWWPSDGFMRHAWSLAVEEQFYLLWPVLLVVFRTRRSRVSLALGVALLTVVLRAHPMLSRFGYDVLRWDALMAGAFVALASPTLPRAFIWVGVLAFGVQSIFPPGKAPYPTWSYLISSVSAVAVLLSRGAWGDSRPLVFFGRISYGLYLWHMLLLRPGLHPLVAVPLSTLIAVLSFVFIEQPCVRWMRAYLARRRERSQR